MKKVKKIMWQDWGTFLGTTMVCSGWEDYEEVKKFLKKKKYTEWLEAMENKPDEFNTHHFSRWTVKDIKYTLLWLIDWKSDVKHYQVLSHELLHAVQFCMPDFLDVNQEYEAVAYQHSYLFEKISKELNNI